MRIAQISDTHIGITTEGEIRVMLRSAAKEKPDVVIHCGDYGGTFQGAPCVRRTVAWMRKAFPNTPILTTIGNHDYWCVSPKRKRATDFGGKIECGPDYRRPTFQIIEV